jgi:hypothetical protein
VEVGQRDRRRLDGTATAAADPADQTALTAQRDLQPFAGGIQLDDRRVRVEAVGADDQDVRAGLDGIDRVPARLAGRRPAAGDLLAGEGGQRERGRVDRFASVWRTTTCRAPATAA